MREAAALLRANGYGVLNEEKLRHHRGADEAPAGIAAPARPLQQQQQKQQQQQQQQQQRQVRLVEPAADRRRPADKRKQAEPSSSEDERPARSAGGARSTQQAAAPPQGMKRVRSSWKMRPLLVGACRLRCWAGRRRRAGPLQPLAAAAAAATTHVCDVHPLPLLLLPLPQTRSCRCSWKGTTPRCCTTMAASSISGCSTASQVGAGRRAPQGLARCSWRACARLQACAAGAPLDACRAAPRCSAASTAAPGRPCEEAAPPTPPAGAADPADGLPYPLVVQDRDLRTLLEIKPPGEGGAPGGELAVAVPAAAAAAGGEGIIVPTVRLLPDAEQPDNLVREQEPPVVQRMQDVEQPDVVGASAAAQAASAAWRSAERAVALDPPYIRYVQVRAAGCAVLCAVGSVG